MLISGLDTASRRPWVVLGLDAWVANRQTDSGLALWILRGAIVIFSFAIPSALVANRVDAEQRKEELEKEMARQFKDDGEIQEQLPGQLALIQDFIDEGRAGYLTYKRTELALEVYPQITLTSLMLLLQPSISKKPTQSGLQGTQDLHQTGRLGSARNRQIKD